ncbi:hypothetical protein [Cyanobium sp. BA20m-14]|nr:hypothetical protein [Cyanobium sp. BA20m-14]
MAGPPQEFPGYGAVVDGEAADRAGGSGWLMAGWARSDAHGHRGLMV